MPYLDLMMVVVVGGGGRGRLRVELLLPFFSDEAWRLKGFRPFFFFRGVLFWLYPSNRFSMSISISSNSGSDSDKCWEGRYSAHNKSHPATKLQMILAQPTTPVMILPSPKCPVGE